MTTALFVLPSDPLYQAALIDPDAVLQDDGTVVIAGPVSASTCHVCASPSGSQSDVARPTADRTEP